MEDSLTVGSLFAGIGGIDLGLERSGFKTAWQVEVDPFCREILAKHFPDAIQFGDIKACKASQPSTCSPADSPVKMFPKPESEKELKALALAFGLSMPVSLGSFDPDTYSLKTYQGCLFPQQTDQPEYQEWSETWPDSGMWDAGSVYELQASAPAILESESSSLDSWLTPHGMSNVDSKGKQGGCGGGAFGNQANHWPTATASEIDRGTNRRYSEGNSGTGRMLKLEAQNWPTARAEDGESAGNHPGAVDSLTGATKHWATPRTLTGGGESAARKQELGREDSGGGDLQAQTQLWQTPATDSFRRRGGDRSDEMGLDQQARFFPTPAGRDYRTPNREPRTDRVGPKAGEQLQNFVEHCLDSRQGQATLDGLTSSENDQTSLQLWPTPRREPGTHSVVNGKRYETSLEYVVREQKDETRRLNPRFVEWLMGFPITWTELRETTDPLTDRTKRLSRLGNAVVPDCAQWIGERLKRFAHSRRRLV